MEEEAKEKEARKAQEEKASEEVVEEETESVSEDSDDLASKTVSELRNMAKEAGVKGYSTMKKDELISALK